MPPYRIIPNVLLNAVEGFDVQNTHLRETLLPNRRPESQLPSCSKCEAAFDELHRAFNGHVGPDREQ